MIPADGLALGGCLLGWVVAWPIGFISVVLLVVAPSFACCRAADSDHHVDRSIVIIILIIIIIIVIISIAITITVISASSS